MQSNAGERPLFKRACVDVEARAEHQSNQSINWVVEYNNASTRCARIFSSDRDHLKKHIFP